MIVPEQPPSEPAEISPQVNTAIVKDLVTEKVKEKKTKKKPDPKEEIKKEAELATEAVKQEKFLKSKDSVVSDAEGEKIAKKPAGNPKNDKAPLFGKAIEESKIKWAAMLAADTSGQLKALPDEAREMIITLLETPIKKPEISKEESEKFAKEAAEKTKKMLMELGAGDLAELVGDVGIIKKEVKEGDQKLLGQAWIEDLAAKAQTSAIARAEIDKIEHFRSSTQLWVYVWDVLYYRGAAKILSKIFNLLYITCPVIMIAVEVFVMLIKFIWTWGWIMLKAFVYMIVPMMLCELVSTNWKEGEGWISWIIHGIARIPRFVFNGIYNMVLAFKYYKNALEDSQLPAFMNPFQWMSIGKSILVGGTDIPGAKDLNQPLGLQGYIDTFKIATGQEIGRGAGIVTQTGTLKASGYAKVQNKDGSVSVIPIKNEYVDEKGFIVPKVSQPKFPNESNWTYQYQLGQFQEFWKFRYRSELAWLIWNINMKEYGKDVTGDAADIHHLPKIDYKTGLLKEFEKGWLSNWSRTEGDDVTDLKLYNLALALIGKYGYHTSNFGNLPQNSFEFFVSLWVDKWVLVFENRDFRSGEYAWYARDTGVANEDYAEKEFIDMLYLYSQKKQTDFGIYATHDRRKLAAQDTYPENYWFTLDLNTLPD